MEKKFSKIILLGMTIGIFMSINVFAGKLDPTIPYDFTNLDINTDGVATFTPPTYEIIDSKGESISQWRNFEAQLLKRVTTVKNGVVQYTYKTTGQVKSCTADENEIDLIFPATGYYQFQIRGINLEGNYSEWTKISDDTTYEGLPISEDNISINPEGSGSGSSSGSGSGSGSGGITYSEGPGVVQTGNMPAGYQYAVVGPNGEILYYYSNNLSYGPYYASQGTNYQYQQSTSQYLGPGYVGNYGNAGQILYPNTGVSNYQQVEAPFTYANNNQIQTYPTQTNPAQTNPAQTNPIQNQNYNYYQDYNNPGNNNSSSIYNPNNNNSSINNPNYSNQNMSPSSSNSYASPQITQGLEIGWHIDGNGRFYYQGNGEVLRSTWYLIDNNYYRFADNGYLLCNQWFKDSSTGYWYYLSGDGKMLTGWQCLNGTWYFFKPQNGNGYGTMYVNTSLYIEDKQWGNGQYAFDANGAMVRNAWYGGYYYNNDGKRAN